MLPIYELKINDSLSDDSEVSYVALVDQPAIQRDFLAFKDEFINPSKGEHKDEFLPRCIDYVITEGKEPDQAIAICNSIWDNHFASDFAESYSDYPEQIDKQQMAGEKVSIDYDDTLSTERGKELAKRLISEGKTVYIISARQDVSGMLGVANELGIPESRVYAMGSNSAKVEKIKELGIIKHYDNNADVVKELGTTGQKFMHSFQIVSEEDHIISGPLMLADELIYRNNEQFGEHYVKFTKDTIKAIAIKFSKRKFQNNVNLMHDQNKKVDGVTMFESFIVDKKRGIMPMAGFEDVADGSWFGSFYVENPKVWQQIKSGELKGFSVEGIFDYEMNAKMQTDEEVFAEISHLLTISDTNLAIQRISELLKVNI